MFAKNSYVINLTRTVAVVVGHYTAEGGSDPILREIGLDGKPRGGKWVASPEKCVGIQGDASVAVKFLRLLNGLPVA